jgi:hypothetical protein
MGCRGREERRSMYEGRDLNLDTKPVYNFQDILDLSMPSSLWGAEEDSRPRDCS